MKNYWLIYALGSAFFASLTTILARIGVADISANVATFIRTIVVCLFLGGWLFIRSERIDQSTLSSSGILFLILSGVTTGLSWLLYFRALQLGNVSQVISIDKLSLPFALVLAIIFLGEHIGQWQWLGIVFIVLGSLLVVLK